MKKLFFVLAILLMASVASAATIPGAVNAKEGPEIWTTTVYNNSGAALESGTVVIWDIDAATGDDDNYVNTSTTESALVAGVVWPAQIATASIGIIAIRGPVNVDMEDASNGNCAADALLCVGSVAGDAKTCTTVANGQGYSFGRCVASGTVGAEVKAFIHAK